MANIKVKKVWTDEVEPYSEYEFSIQSEYVDLKDYPYYISNDELDTIKKVFEKDIKKIIIFGGNLGDDNSAPGISFELKRVNAFKNLIVKIRFEVDNINVSFSKRDVCETTFQTDTILFNDFINSLAKLKNNEVGSEFNILL